MPVTAGPTGLARDHVPQEKREGRDRLSSQRVTCPQDISSMASRGSSCLGPSESTINIPSHLRGGSGVRARCLTRAPQRPSGWVTDEKFEQSSWSHDQPLQPDMLTL